MRRPSWNVKGSYQNISKLKNVFKNCEPESFKSFLQYVLKSDVESIDESKCSCHPSAWPPAELESAELPKPATMANDGEHKTLEELIDVSFSEVSHKDCGVSSWTLLKKDTKNKKILL